MAVTVENIMVAIVAVTGIMIAAATAAIKGKSAFGQHRRNDQYCRRDTTFALVVIYCRYRQRQQIKTVPSGSTIILGDISRCRIQE